MGEFQVGHNRSGHEYPYEDFRARSVHVEPSLTLEQACDLVVGRAWAYPSTVSNGTRGAWKIVDARTNGSNTICIFKHLRSGDKLFVKIEGKMQLGGPW